MATVCELPCGSRGGAEEAGFKGRGTEGFCGFPCSEVFGIGCDESEFSGPRIGVGFNGLAAVDDEIEDFCGLDGGDSEVGWGASGGDGPFPEQSFGAGDEQCSDAIAICRGAAECSGELERAICGDVEASDGGMLLVSRVATLGIQQDPAMFGVGQIGARLQAVSGPVSEWVKGDARGRIGFGIRQELSPAEFPGGHAWERLLEVELLIWGRLVVCSCESGICEPLRAVECKAAVHQQQGLGGGICQCAGGAVGFHHGGVEGVEHREWLAAAHLDVEAAAS